MYWPKVNILEKKYDKQNLNLNLMYIAMHGVIQTGYTRINTTATLWQSHCR